MMNSYSIALFLHVVGALGFFVALGLEWMSLQQLQRISTAEQLREWFQNSRGMRGLGGISMLVLLGAGIYMTIIAWGGADWIGVAFGSVILMGVLGGVLSGPRMAAIQRSMGDETGNISSTLYQLIHHPLISLSIRLRIGMALGIVFLMCVKPTLVESLITMGIATVLGLALALPGIRRKPTPELAA
jgi:hypothetical protein